jgi:hypothetical protein
MSRFMVRQIDPFFTERDAAAMIRVCERFATYGMYSQEAAEAEIAQGLLERHDAVVNFLRTGGRHARQEPFETLAARTIYFRESYAYGDRVMVDGIEPFLHHEGLVEAARAIHGRPVIEPAIVYANLLVPGQELAVHTDVPEFRGANRKKHPQWLLVVMHHSGLFDPWRVPIATAVSWWSEQGGGEFVFWPHGPAAPPVVLPARRNTAIVLDTDSIFHAVDPVREVVPLPPLQPGMTLRFDGDDAWSVRAGDTVVATYRWEELRFSISWKAYCFADEAEQRAFRQHTDDLELDPILDRLVDDLRAKNRLVGPRPEPTDLALLLIEEYVRFPAPAGAAPADCMSAPVST